MHKIAAFLLCVPLLFASGATLAQSPDPSLLTRADALVRAGKAEEAWHLLLPLEPEHAGHPSFDLQLAVAALESGRASRATFILERVIAVEPGNAAARMEMGRALFALGDYERAQREFAWVMQSGPSPAIREAVAAYRQRMQAADASREPRTVTAYAEVMVGRDTNVTTGAAAGSVFIPSLGTNFLPDALFARQADGFTALGGGLSWRKPINERRAINLGADFARRWHSSVEELDWQQAELHGSLEQRLAGDAALAFTLRHNEYELDGARYRRLQAATGEWSRTFADRARVAATAHGTRIRYLREDVRASSSDLVGLGVNGTYVVDARTRTLAFGGLFAGYDDATAGRTDGDRRIYGASAGVQRNLGRRSEIFLSLALLKSKFLDVNPDFVKRREDRQADLALGMAWRPCRQWSVIPQVTLTRNSSNLPLADYRRAVASVAVRRLWD